MSHISTGSCQIKDLTALEAAARELGGVFVANQKTYKWYGRRMRDTPLPEGIKESELGHCSHVIKIDGVGYEVGVVAQKDGGYRLMYDYWGPGEGLVKNFGTNLGKLQQMYSKHAILRAARSRGAMVRQSVGKNGSIQLSIITT